MLLTLASPPKEVRQVLRINMLQQSFFIVITQNGKFGPGAFIQEVLDYSPDTSKDHRCIHDEGTTHLLWIAVLHDLGIMLEHPVRLLVHLLHGETGHVHY